ncbi:MAG: hypothetical protein HC878_00145 [Leptolyngbyaceae cyanobacterium SL_5_14]|nr:hypothetical protein [Leptolyngbyaceae cyanobacterium SL_5_14]
MKIKACDSLNRTIQYSSALLQDQSKYPRVVPLSGTVLRIAGDKDQYVRLLTPSGWLQPLPAGYEIPLGEPSINPYNSLVKVRSHGTTHRGFNIE